MAQALENYKPLSSAESIGMSGVIADAQRPMLIMDTRYNYMTKHLEVYKSMIRFRAYAIACFLAGLWLLFNIPFLSLAAFFLTLYYWQMFKLTHGRSLGNTRTVMIGH
ncbi:MAG: hypothetical protein V1834_04695 [Candidatus Micrarchaeota archaeon]